MKITETGCADDIMLFVKKNAQSFGDFGKRATFALAIGKPITVVLEKGGNSSVGRA